MTSKIPLSRQIEHFDILRRAATAGRRLKPSELELLGKSWEATALLLDALRQDEIARERTRQVRDFDDVMGTGE